MNKEEKMVIEAALRDLIDSEFDYGGNRLVDSAIEKLERLLAKEPE